MDTLHRSPSCISPSFQPSWGHWIARRKLLRLLVWSSGVSLSAGLRSLLYICLERCVLAATLRPLSSMYSSGSDTASSSSYSSSFSYFIHVFTLSLPVFFIYCSLFSSGSDISTRRPIHSFTACVRATFVTRSPSCYDVAASVDGKWRPCHNNRRHYDVVTVVSARCYAAFDCRHCDVVTVASAPCYAAFDCRSPRLATQTTPTTATVNHPFLLFPQPNSRTEMPRKSRMEAHHTGNPWTYLEAKRSKVKVTRPINAVIDNPPYAGWRN